MVLSGFSYTTLVQNTKQNWLWYDKYKYKVEFNLEQVGLHRWYDIRMVDRELERSNIRVKHANNLIELRKVLVWKGENIGNFKILTHCNSITVYATRYDIVEELAKILNQPTTVQEVVHIYSRPKEVIYHKNPKHQFRVYFKSKVYSSNEIIELRDFFLKHQNLFFPSANLNFFLHWDTRGKAGRWNDGNLFFDYDNEAYQSIYYMHFYQHIKKEYAIQKPPVAA